MSPSIAGSVALNASGVSVRIGHATLVDGADLQSLHGEVLALVGPNGAGKSTLLGVMAGDRQPTDGTMELEGRLVSDWAPEQLARRRAVLAQENQVAFPFRVHQVVQMGRAPWRGTERDVDDPVRIASALEQCDVSHLAHRTFTSLSGGEKARVSLARVLAQDATIVLLDEPTAALDLRHQEDVLRIARELARTGAAVVVVLHDLSLAAAYADRIAIMEDGRLAAVGAPAVVLQPELLERIYGIGVKVVADPDGGAPIVVPRRPGG